jgi:hypothetical protein
MTPPKCSERSCPFPAAGGQSLCAHHLTMFGAEESPSSLSVDATDEDVFSAVFNDKSISIEKRWSVSTEEWLEKKQWKKTLDSLGAQRRRRRKRDEGLCYDCGTRLIGTRRKTCPTCCEKRKQKRQLWKSLGVCITCGKRESRSGVVSCSHCEDCRIRRQEKKAALRPKRMPGLKNARGYYRSSIAASNRRQDRLHAVGICTWCGRPNDCKTRYCTECKLKHKRRVAKKNEAWLEKGICIVCHVNPLSAGKRHCEICSQARRQVRQASSKARKASTVQRLWPSAPRAWQEKVLRMSSKQFADQI